MCVCVCVCFPCLQMKESKSSSNEFIRKIQDSERFRLYLNSGPICFKRI